MTATRLLIVLILSLGLLWVPTDVLAQTAPEPTPSPSATSPQPEEPGLFDFDGRVRRAISEWFSDLLTSALRPVFDLLGRTVFSTPAIGENERVRELWGFSLGVADATLLMFVLAGAAFVTVTGGTEVRITAKELLPRLLIAAGAANLSLLALREMVGFSNALSHGVLASIDADSVGRSMAESLFTSSALNPFLAILALVVVVLAVLVIVTYVVRVAVLVILAAAAPLMLVTHSLPQTETWARIWWRSTLALLAVPVAQSFLVAAAFRVFLTDSLLGFSSSSLINLLVLGALLYLLFKVPLWALNAALGGAASSAWTQAKGLATRAAKTAVAA